MDGHRSFELLEELVRAGRVKREYLAGSEVARYGHRSFSLQPARGNAGGRSPRSAGASRGPFEPAYALGNRVLGPASVAPPDGPDGLAELEHPRTVMITLGMK